MYSCYESRYAAFQQRYNFGKMCGPFSWSQKAPTPHAQCIFMWTHAVTCQRSYFLITMMIRSEYSDGPVVFYHAHLFMFVSITLLWFYRDSHLNTI